MYYYTIILFLFTIVFAKVESPSLFKYKQGSYQAFYFFRSVTIDSMLVDSLDWVGTFNCSKWDADSTNCLKLGACVGSRQWNTAKCGGGICDLPAMGTGGESSKITQGYLDPGQYPAFIIYDHSKGIYYNTNPRGNVQKQMDICRNGYPYCYGWENHNFYLIDRLETAGNYMDCSGKIGGSSQNDLCGVCGGAGPKYTCKKNNQSYCTEYEYEQNCITTDSK